MTRVVVRPVNDGRTSRIVHEFAAHLDAVAGLSGAARCDADVVDHFKSSGTALHVKGFVHGVRPCAKEEARHRRDGCRKIDPSWSVAGVCRSQIHRPSFTRAGPADKSCGLRSEMISPMKTIQTQRLRLIPVTSENAPLLWEVLQEPDLRDYQDLPDLNRAQFLRAVGARPKSFASGVVGRFEWLLHYARGEGDPLGWVSLRVAESDRSAAEIGYSVVRVHRGKGIATEAVAALIDEAFSSAGLREIRAYCLAENRSSRAVLRHVGFDEEAMLPRGATVQGKPVDVISHSLKREFWTPSLRANRQATGS